MSLSLGQLKKITQDLGVIARGAGRILVDFKKKRKPLSVHIKDNQGPASEADLASEKFILLKLAALNKKWKLEASFLAEEDSYKNKKKLKELKKSPYLWCVDPLDGTNNYLMGIDYYAVSIALIHQGEVICGVIYRPETKELYFATKNGGAFKSVEEKRPISLRILQKKSFRPSAKSLNESVLATGFALEKGQKYRKEFSVFRKIMSKARAIRRMGSATLDLCFVAEGIFDGFWERGLAPWDIAAASLIVSESGFSVSNYSGEKLGPFDLTILACNRSLQSTFLRYLDSSS